MSETPHEKQSRRLDQDIRLRDLSQIVMGAATLGVPFALTEEAWTLGAELSGNHILGIFLASLLVVSSYIYFHYHHGHVKLVPGLFVARVLVVYFLAAAVSAGALFLINKLPPDDLGTAISTIVVVAFPSCFAAAVLDSLD